MPIRHVYEKIQKIVRGHGETWITLEDGTVIGLPAAAEAQAAPVSNGMKVLLDLDDWASQGGVARLYVYHNHNTVMTCTMGEGCAIRSPVLD